MLKTKWITRISSISIALMSLNTGAQEIGLAKKAENLLKKSEMTQVFYTNLPTTQTQNQSETNEEMGYNNDPQKLYQLKGCNACHGLDAETPSQPLYPKLAGQNEQYILGQMRDFKSGSRDNSLSVVMTGSLSPIKNDEEIKVIAKWLASLTVEVEIIETDYGAKLYKEKKCHLCHGNKDNIPILPTYPKLAGQNYKYLIAQMKDIKSGKRKNGNSVVMKGIMSKVTENEIEIIAQWLQSIEKKD
jgi:cytochrome c553